MATSTKSTKKATEKKSNPKPASKEKAAAKKLVKKAKVEMISRVILEALKKKHGHAVYHGTREKFDGKKVEIVGVRDESRHGYDARVLFSDGVRLYVSPTSLTAK